MTLGAAGGETFNRASAVLARYRDSLPALVVLDLDYTIWPYYCETQSTRDEPAFYPDVPGIVAALKAAGVPMAVASKTPRGDIASALLTKARMLDAFHPFVAFSSHGKTPHFEQIRSETGVALSDMLFFDDEPPNIRTMGRAGVTCVLVKNGLDVAALEEGLRAHAKSRLDKAGF